MTFEIGRDEDGVVRLWAGSFMLELDDDIVEKYVPWVDGEDSE